MIVKMDYQDRGIVGVRTTYGGKTKNHYIRFVVDEYSLESAIQHIKGNKWVVALDYEGDLAHLRNLEELPTVPLIVTKRIDSVSDIEIGFINMQIPPWVRVAIKTPRDFKDMRLIKQISEQYPNFRFCGGCFLRLPGCNIGCIDREDLPNKIAESKVDYYTEKCACIKTTMHLEEVEGLEIIYKDMEIDKAEVKKRVVGSLQDLLG